MDKRPILNVIANRQRMKQSHGQKVARPFHSSAGFTLIEVMTAFTILAIIASIIFTVVVGSTRRSRDLVRETELRASANAILNLVAEDLEGTFVHQGIVPHFVGRDEYTGDRPADDVEFLTTSTLPLRPDELAGDVAEVSYSLIADDEGKTALFRREQVPVQAPFDEGGASVQVSGKVTSLSLRYYDGTEWQDTWDSADSLHEHMAGRIPQAVEIELTMEDGGSYVKVRTRVAPPLAALGKP